MEKVIIGAGGFASEIRAHYNNFEMKCFVDHEYYSPNNDNIYSLNDFDPNKYEVIIAIGDPKLREDMVYKLPSTTKYFTYVHESASILGDVTIGEGSIIAAGCIITTNIRIGKHAHLNLLSTIGHDCIIGDYFTTAPGAKISGNCNIGDRVYFGTNSSVRQKINICDDVTIGLNAGVVKHINQPGVYVGVPAKKIKSSE
jgi:sugar O-acyltransferase (sialic acid O-acetyltransferase NeuD family)